MPLSLPDFYASGVAAAVSLAEVPPSPAEAEGACSHCRRPVGEFFFHLDGRLTCRACVRRELDGQPSGLRSAALGTALLAVVLGLASHPPALASALLGNAANALGFHPGESTVAGVFALASVLRTAWEKQGLRRA